MEGGGIETSYDENNDVQTDRETTQEGDTYQADTRVWEGPSYV